MSRRDVQHAAHKATFGGLYPRPCRDKILEALSPSDGQTRRILDLGKWIVRRVWPELTWFIFTGSGSGAWYVYGHHFKNASELSLGALIWLSNFLMRRYWE
jgi:hypothetical protein